MIADLFLYFAQFPDKANIKAMATMGRSAMAGYKQLLDALDQLPDTSRVPEIENYVYGQTFEDIQQRLDRLMGTFLFADYGGFSIQPIGQRSIDVSEQIAVTVAMRMGERTDLMERMLASNQTLHLLNRVYAWMIADAEAGDLEWLHREHVDRAEIVPFVSPELHSTGWTLMIDATAPDMLGTRFIARHLLNS